MSTFWSDRLRKSRDVEIRLVTASVRVPRGCSLLTGLASIVGGRIVEGNYCTTGECAHCEVVVVNRKGNRESVLACQTPVEDGLHVLRLSKYLERDVEP